MGWKPAGGDGRLGQLFSGAGLTPYWGSQEADTMDSHRLAWHAAQVSAEHGERMWRAISERYFEGKRTDIRPIRLDSHAMLLECAVEAGLDVVEARRILASDAYRAEVQASFESVQRAGIDSIPVLIFEVAEVVAQQGETEGRIVHHGSGTTGDFRAILEKLHAACAAQGG